MVSFGELMYYIKNGPTISISPENLTKSSSR